MGRSPCCEKAHTNKGAWSKEEDQLLIHYIRVHGEGCWRSLPKAAGLLRCGKSCRLRWINYLRPDLKRGNFTPHEHQLIIHLHTLLGNKWSLIAAKLAGRTDNEIKNYWNTHIKKRKLMSGGLNNTQTNSPLFSEAKTSSSTNNSNIINTLNEYHTIKLERNYKEMATSDSLQGASCTTDDGHHHHLDLQLSIGLPPFRQQPSSTTPQTGI